MTCFAGVDVGSCSAKAVVLEGGGECLGRGLEPSGANLVGAAAAALEAACRQAGVERRDLARVAATGFGRHNVDFAALRRTEIDCHARGAWHFFPRAITVIDIGGQDNKIIRLNEKGQRLSFVMNRKCAAGTGAFLEELALRLKVPLGKLAALAAAGKPGSTSLGSFCTVFAMTEVLSQIRAGVPVEDIVRAALASVARRVLEAQAICGEVVATGGVVAHQPLLVEMLQEILQVKVLVPPWPQFTGALGAALAAREQAAAAGCSPSVSQEV